MKIDRKFMQIRERLLRNMSSKRPRPDFGLQEDKRPQIYQQYQQQQQQQHPPHQHQQYLPPTHHQGPPPSMHLQQQQQQQQQPPQYHHQQHLYQPSASSGDNVGMMLANMAGIGGGGGGAGMGGLRGGMQRMSEDMDRRSIGSASVKRGDSSIRSSDDGADSDKEEDRKRRWMTKDQARVSASS